jgi:hypothetical protein
LKNENNKPILIVSSIFLVIFIVVAGINYFFLDNRKNMTAFASDEMGFNNTVVEIDKIYLDKKNNLAQLNLRKIDYFIISEEFNISIKDQNEQQLGIEIIKDDLKEVDTDIYQTDYRIRFKVPEDIWYIKGKISRNNISYDFTIDYRDFKKTKLE